MLVINYNQPSGILDTIIKNFHITVVTKASNVPLFRNNLSNAEFRKKIRNKFHNHRLFGTKVGKPIPY